MTRLLSLTSAACLVATCANKSGAQRPGSHARHYAPAPAAACIRACPNDMSPCDPVYMKRADGRCSGVIATPVF
jgi:hypothetical protein